jgi:rhamnulokinase
VHRFANDPVRVAGRLHWDILRLLHELEQGIRAAQNAGLGELCSIGIDAWGLDFGLIDRTGELLGNPYHYRDERWPVAMAEVLNLVPRTEIYSRTGIQFMPVNSLYQLYGMHQANPALVDRAAALLMIPDLLRYFLSGERTSEVTDASTTQFLGIESVEWDRGLLERLGLPTALLTALVPPATPAGKLRPDVAVEVGSESLPVVAVAGHDTASAVAAIPGEGEFAYLSCGTWSLLGTELAQPVVTAQALDWNFTNERGLGGTFRLLKNIMGLWLVEGCRRAWERAGAWPGYDAMAQAAVEAPPFQAWIDPDDARFLNPHDMPAAIASYCRDTGQTPPESPGAMMRCVLESLALTYRLVLERTEHLVGRRFPGLHVVGGGTRNTTLLQFTADAIARPVWGGPAEATAIGNLLCQFLARGDIGSIAEGRALIRASLPVTVYEPSSSDLWDGAFARFLAVTSRAAT